MQICRRRTARYTTNQCNPSFYQVSTQVSIHYIARIAPRPYAFGSSGYGWILPGSVGKIDYRYLNAKIEAREEGYEPVAEDVEHYQMQTKLGNIVGVHVYPAAGIRKEVVVFLHGNTRTPRHLNNLLRLASDNRTRSVFAPDFPGYDLSTTVPNKDGSLELAAIANCQALREMIKGMCPDAEIIVIGRSMGTPEAFQWLPFDEVKKLCCITPYADPAAVVAGLVVLRIISWFPGLVVLMNMLSRWVCKEAVPVCSKSDALPDVETCGFSPSRRIDAMGDLDGKGVLLMPASRDKLVPEESAEILAEKVAARSARCRVLVLYGGHRALPGDERNATALVEWNLFLTS